MEIGNGIINFTKLSLRGIQGNDLTMMPASYTTEGNKNTNEKKRDIHLYLSAAEIPFCDAVSDFGGSNA